MRRGSILDILFVFYGGTMRENEYQAKLIKKIKQAIPGCTVLKNDPNYLQGIPDLTVLYKDKWALLEVKAEEGAPSQPNQEYYIEHFSNDTFATFVYPENEKEVLLGIQQAFGLA